MSTAAEGSDRPDLRAVGERIEVLLEASAAQGALARERSEQLVRLITDLYGAGLERVLEILHAAGRLDPEVLADLADDDLVASLLLVHGLHPYDLGTRVQRALHSLRPSLQAQWVDVELLGLDAEGTVRVRLGGELSGCAVGPLVQSVQEAIEAAAPDAVEVRVQVDAGAPSSLIPVSALRSRLTQVASASSAGTANSAAPVIG